MSALWRARDIRFCVVAFLVGRVAFSLLAIAGWYLPYEKVEPATHWTAQDATHGWLNAFPGFERYDAQWYLQIASHGYRPGDPSSAYFPLYPLLVHGTGWVLGGHWLLAAYVVSNSALVVALVLLYRLTAAELSERTARLTVIVLLTNPFAFFLYAPYSESLFLALCLVCLTALRNARWVPAAGAAALASATRSTGLALGAAMAVQAFHDVQWRPAGAAARKRLARTLPLSAAAAVGVVGYLVFWQHLSRWQEPVDVQRTAFHRQPTWPWTSLVDGVRIAFDTLRYPGWLITNIEVGLVLVYLGLAVVAVRRYAPTYGAFVVTSVVMPLCLARRYSPLTSVPRYYLVIFPLLWALAEGLQRRRAVRSVVLATSCTLLVLLTLLFVSWHDVL